MYEYFIVYNFVQHSSIRNCILLFYFVLRVEYIECMRVKTKKEQKEESKIKALILEVSFLGTVLEHSVLRYSPKTE